jgi:hypothetical protein
LKPLQHISFGKTLLKVASISGGKSMKAIRKVSRNDSGEKLGAVRKRSAPASFTAASGIVSVAAMRFTVGKAESSSHLRHFLGQSPADPPDYQWIFDGAFTVKIRFMLAGVEGE